MKSAIDLLAVVLLLPVAPSASAFPHFGQQMFETRRRMGREARKQPEEMEAVVRRYFQGVNDKDPELIRSCFEESATIRDVCGVSDSQRTVPAQALADRCVEFLAAHPDTVVDFHHGPECGRSSDWVFAHWYETGTWSGTSCGIEPTHQPMAVEGQTPFLVDPVTLRIKELVVTRTFTDWEKLLIAKSQ